MAQPCCIFSKPIDTQSQLKILEPINTCRDDGPRYTNSSLVFGIWCGHSDDAYSQSMLSFKWINFILFGFNIDETVRCVQFNPMSTQLTSTYVLMITVGSDVIGLETRTSYYLVVLSQLIIDLKVINVSYFLVYICT
eukprot:434894_1